AEEYRYIIDCLLNLPLLYWASRETCDPKYREIALIHARTTLANSVRPDDSTYHTFYMDPATGAPVRGATKQVYKDYSAWARGQAW
ncbi:glucoronyl hydrolase, partial [Rhizobium leguminosarum]